MAAHASKLLGRRTLRSLSQPSTLTHLVPCAGEQSKQPIRGYPTSKHYDPRFRKQRGEKFLKVDLPKFVQLKLDKEKKDERSPDEIRKEMKKEGRLPPRNFDELPINTSCTRAVLDEYKPPEGDGKVSFLSKAGLQDNVNKLMKSTKSLKHVRKLKKYEDFVETEFAEEAQKVVIEAQELLQDVFKNQDRLHELVTEKAFPEIVHGLENKTMHWKFVESVEPPRVVQIRVEDMITQDNLFAQVTVRMHTKQILAIYDRFGRLMYGDPYTPKSVIEYVVMEKWISDTYGIWRIHGKIIPDWMSSRDSPIRTYKMPVFEPIDVEEGDKKLEKSESVEGSEEGDRNKLATA